MKYAHSFLVEDFKSDALYWFFVQVRWKRRPSVGNLCHLPRAKDHQNARLYVVDYGGFYRPTRSPALYLLGKELFCVRHHGKEVFCMSNFMVRFLRLPRCPPIRGGLWWLSLCCTFSCTSSSR